MYHGDVTLEDTIDIKFTTVQSTGAPTTLAGSPVISAYIGNSTTQITAGITLSVDFDSVTGLNNVRVAATSANGYTAGTNVALVITTGTVNSVSAVGYVVGTFSISARSALRPTVAGRTLDVSAGGEGGVDWANVGSPSTTVSLSGTTVATTTTATNVTTVNGLAAGVLTATAIAGDAITAAKVAADVGTEIATAVLSAASSSPITANMTQISGDSAAADALETAFDGTAGPVPELGIVDRGTAQSASATGVVLRSAAAFADDTLIGMTILVFGSTQGYWQSRVITDNALSGDAVTVDTWTVTPSGTITYIILGTPPASASAPIPASVVEVTQAGIADFFSVDSGTTYGSAVGGSVVKEIADNASGGGGGADAMLLQSTTIASLASQTSFTLTAGSADDDAYNGCMLICTDQSTAVQKCVGLISDYTGSTRTVTLAASPGIFTMATGDAVKVYASPKQLPNALPVTAGGIITAGTGTAQLNPSSGNVVLAATTHTGATIPTVTTTTTATNLTNAPTNGDFTATMKTSIGTAVAASAVASVTGNVGGNVTGSVGSVTGNVGGTVNGLTSTAQGNVRTAVGLASANLDTQLSTIDSEIGTIDGIVDAILVDTGTTIPGTITALQATADAVEADTQNIQSRIPAALVSGRMNSNVAAVNGVVVQGSGTNGDSMRPA